MKHLILLAFVFICVGCTKTQLVETWKNPDIDTYAPTKIFVLGLTKNVVAQQKFENKLKQNLQERGAEVHLSLETLDSSFKTDRLTEEQLNRLEDRLINDGFDTIIFSKVIGIENKVAYTNNFSVYDETFVKFTEDYLRYQDVFYNPDYYEQYTIYHAETSMFCICPTKDRELIWKGYIDIIDPQNIDKTINDYIELIIKSLEEQKLISPLAINPKVETTQ